MSIKDYQFDGEKFEVTPEVKADFDNKGYILIRNLFNEKEVQKLRGVLEGSDVVNQYAHGLDDGADRKARMCLWYQPGNDVTGTMAKTEKLAGTVAKLLGGDVYHYHTKVILKDAHTGGRFMWHQDYGYWYKFTYLKPDIATVFIAVDPSKRDNGCLEILEGTNRVGRVDHVPLPGGQMHADPERLELLKERFPHLHVEMEPGDALIFHCNVLHSSSQNNSPNRRWAFLTAYNRMDNIPVQDHTRKPICTKIDPVPNSAMLECTVDWDLDAKDMMSQEVRDAGWKEDVLDKAGTA